MDPDEFQEYQTLLLEGHPEPEARKLARSANNAVASRRQLGPNSGGDVRHGHGMRVLVTDYRFEQWLKEPTPVTLDTRTDSEREADWQSAERAAQLVAQLVPRQQEIVKLFYGLDTGTPMSWQQVADTLGITVKQAQKARDRALARLRSLSATPTAADLRRQTRHREHNARYYAKKVLQKSAHDLEPDVTLVTSETGCPA